MKLLLLAIAMVVTFKAAAFAQDASDGKTDKTLIAFFSKTNNTRSIAEHIQARIGGDLFHVDTKKPYPADYHETTRVARAEQDNNERPELAATISAEDMKNYDVVFIGYPSWWGTMPMAMFTFLEQHDFSGKTIIPFCTHEGSGLGRGPSDIAKLVPGATLKEGLAVRGGSVGTAQNDVEQWLRQLGYL